MNYNRILLLETQILPEDRKRLLILLTQGRKCKMLGHGSPIDLGSILGSHLTSCVMLGKVLNLSEVHFTLPSNGRRWSQHLDAVLFMGIKHVDGHKMHSKCSIEASCSDCIP